MREVPQIGDTRCTYKQCSAFASGNLKKPIAVIGYAKGGVLKVREAREENLTLQQFVDRLV
jgi:hypothetical protein